MRCRGRPRFASCTAIGLLAAATVPGADFVLPEPGARLPAAIELATARIRADALRDHIAWLASPARDGRGLGTPGLATAADYVATSLADAGLAPPRQGRGPAAWFQAVELREVREPGGTLTLRSAADGRSRTWRAGVGCVLPPIAPRDITAEVVFAGHGIREPALGHDDFRDLDVRDRIVVFVGGVPPGERWQRRELVERWATARPQDRYDARLPLLRELGAKAAIAVEHGLAARIASGAEPREPYFVPAQGERPSGDPPLVRVTPDVLAWLGPEVTSGWPRSLAGATATLHVTGRTTPHTSNNVIGVLQGADERGRDEAVVIGAHLDHLGRTGGVVHPGASDNASGVAAALEMARAFAKGPARPRRTLVFAFWTGEEAGHFGSDHYVREPVWPLAQTTAYLNLDTIAYGWRAEQIHELVTSAGPDDAAAILAMATPANFIEPGLDRNAPWLGTALADAARGTGIIAHLDRTDGRDGGSDYRAFARRNVPWIRFFGNFFADYHGPGDTPDRLDPSQVERMARLAFATAWLIADGSYHPQDESQASRP